MIHRKMSTNSIGGLEPSGQTKRRFTWTRDKNRWVKSTDASKSSGAWVQVESTSGESPYFYNKETGNTQWTYPAGFDGTPDEDDAWEERIDSDSGIYYFNRVSGKSHWEMPEAIKKKLESEAAAEAEFQKDLGSDKGGEAGANGDGDAGSNKNGKYENSTEGEKKGDTIQGTLSSLGSNDGQVSSPPSSPDSSNRTSRRDTVHHLSYSQHSSTSGYDTATKLKFSHDKARMRHYVPLHSVLSTVMFTCAVVFTGLNNTPPLILWPGLLAVCIHVMMWGSKADSSSVPESPRPKEPKRKNAVKERQRRPSQLDGIKFKIKSNRKHSEAFKMSRRNSTDRSPTNSPK